MHLPIHESSFGDDLAIELPKFDLWCYAKSITISPEAF